MRNILGATVCTVALTAAMTVNADPVTWYLQGSFTATDASTPADIAALVPGGALFQASFSFDSAIVNNPILFNSAEYYYTDHSALGQTSLDVNGQHYASSGNSNIIEYADYNGEQLTLNGGAVTGPVPSAYTWAALDVLQLGHSGLGTADPSTKYPWFSPFGGAKGAFQMISATAPPDLSLSDHPATLDLFFFDASTSTYYHREALVSAIQDTPFAVSDVPEPSTFLLLPAGLVALPLSRRRARQHDWVLPS